MCIYLNIIISYRFQLRTKYTGFFLFRFKILAIVSSKKRVTFRALESLGIAQRITFCQERLLCAVTEADLLGDLLGINSAFMRWLIHREKIELVCVFLKCWHVTTNMWLISSPHLAFIHMIHTSWESALPSDSCDKHTMVTSMCIFHYLYHTPKKLERLTVSTEKNLATKNTHVSFLRYLPCFFLNVPPPKKRTKRPFN